MNAKAQITRAFTLLAAASLVLIAVLGAASVARAATIFVVVGQTNSGGANGVNQYNPATVFLAAGDTLTWNSAPDGRSHDVTSHAEAVAGTPDWQSATLKSGTATTTFSRTFSGAGTVTYYCSLHAARPDADPAIVDASIASGKMVGKIVVSAAAPTDTTGPTTSAVAASPNPTNSAASVTLTATVSDTQTNVAAAEFSIGASAAAAGSGTAAAAADGAFNSTTESVSATVSTSGFAAGTTITLWVRGKDAATNWGAAASVALSITATPPGSLQTSVTVNPGTLTNSGYPIGFGSMVLTGADLTMNAPSSAWRAIDARGSGAGWNVTFTATDFASATAGIAAANFKVRLLQSNVVKIAGNTSPVSLVTTFQPLGGTPLKLLSAGVGQGMGTYDYTCDWQLSVPAQTMASAYQATVVVSVNSGP